MKYYILNSDDTNMDKYIMCDSAAIGDTNQYDVMSGRRIGSWEEKVLLYSSSNSVFVWKISFPNCDIVNKLNCSLL